MMKKKKSRNTEALRIPKLNIFRSLIALFPKFSAAIA
jgi:hypothetical protein